MKDIEEQFYKDWEREKVAFYFQDKFWMRDK